MQKSRGISHVFVNGRVGYTQGEVTDAGAGQIVERA
jgi:hypothetical protein